MSSSGLNRDIRVSKWVLPIIAFMLLAAQCSPAPTLAPPTPYSGPTIRIALLSPSAGEMATLGRMMRNGSLMAFDRWNNQGGLLGRPIEWTIYDTACQFDTARQATQAALDDGFEFIVGPLCSEAAIAAAEVVEGTGVVMISPTATHPLVTVNGQGQSRPTVFRVAYAYPLQGRAAARFARESLRVDKVALLVDPSDDYSASLADTFDRRFSLAGGQVVYRATYAPGDLDFTATLMAIKNAGAQLIYLPATPAVVNRLAGQLAELDSSSEPYPILLGSDRWDSAELDLTATASSYFTTHFELDDQRPEVTNWAETYKSIYAIEPDSLAALGYEAAMILTTAIDQTGTLEPAAVAEALARGSFDGISGQIRFDRQHNPIKPIPVIHIEAGAKKISEFINVEPEGKSSVNESF